MFLPASVWFCCLRTEDKVAVVATATLFAAVANQPIDEATFQTVWGLTMLSLNGYYETILFLYDLEHTFIVIPDEPPIPAIGIVNLPLWLDIEGFILTGGAVCVDGCDVPSFVIP